MGRADFYELFFRDSKPPVFRIKPQETNFFCAVLVHFFNFFPSLVVWAYDNKKVNGIYVKNE